MQSMSCTEASEHSDKDNRSRSNAQNRLMWAWLDQISRYLSARGKGVHRSDLHEMLKLRFLGRDDNGEPKSSRDLSVEGFMHYLFKIDLWAMEIGLYIETPQDRWYQRLIEQARGGR